MPRKLVSSSLHYWYGFVSSFAVSTSWTTRTMRPSTSTCRTWWRRRSSTWSRPTASKSARSVHPAVISSKNPSTSSLSHRRILERIGGSNRESCRNGRTLPRRSGKPVKGKIDRAQRHWSNERSCRSKFKHFRNQASSLWLKCTPNLFHERQTQLLLCERTFCSLTQQDNYSIGPSVLGRISSYYYLHHATVKMFKDAMSGDTSLKELIDVLSVRNLFGLSE